MSSSAAGRKAARSSPPEGSRSYPRALRLTKNPQYRLVYGTGRRLNVPTATLFMRENDCGLHRLGVTVTRRVGNAVQRNRMKRRVREIFRRNRAGIPGTYDIVVNVKAAALASPLRDMESQIVGAIRKEHSRRPSPGPGSAS